MLKRFFVIALVVLTIFTVGCAGGETAAGNESTQAGGDSADGETALNGAESGFEPASRLIGMVVADNGALNGYHEMHGFLRTAENLGYAARLFRYTGVSAKDAVEEAIAAGCEGIVVYDPSGTAAKDAVISARQKGVRVVSSYYANDNADASVVADQTEYLEEVARSIAQRMSERSLKTGKILVYGYSGVALDNAFGEFQKAIAEYYPGYTVVSFERGSVGGSKEDEAIRLANYIYYNRDIKGMFCVDQDGSAIAVKARGLAQKMLKGSMATPAPTPEPTPVPAGMTQEPVNENLLKEILISVFGSGITDENIRLMEDNDIYAVISEPHYESAGQAAMLLDRLIRGQTVAAETQINIPIVRQDTITKYQAVYEQVKEWFGLGAEA